MPSFATPEEEWHAYLTGTHPAITRGRRYFRLLPSGPRCRLCLAPFGAPGSAFLRRYGFYPWEKNPNVCKRCLTRFSDVGLSGTEVELSMLFADVRGSSKLARSLPVWDFTRLMDRFYTVASDVLIRGDAVIEKFVGDEVVGLFLPFIAGQDHTRRAIETADELLRATGHGSADGPWVPLGSGVHTGTAFVGLVGSGERSTEFTALGDAMNTAAHLASQAAGGEILVSDRAASAAELDDQGLERRHVSLKGHPVDAVVLSIRSVPTVGP